MVQESTNNNVGAAAGAIAPLGLPLHTRLGEFEIIDVIGEGGFSIVYLARDHQLQRTVAIKEYLPGAIAYRNADGMVQPRFEKYESTFKTGLQSVLKEARVLAQFEHHSLIRIHRFWEQNGTAYMVMQYCQGKTLRQILQTDATRGTDEVWLKQIMAPVLDALRMLHSRHYFHRDLSPDNIMILESGAPMLLDFGAARQVIGDMTQALTVILKPGFAPIEQYADDESMRQGPWTDIYGVGAVLYYAVTGKAPTASVARLVKDPLKKLATLPDIGVSQEFAGAIDHALGLFPADRPQSVDDFLAELLRNDASISYLPISTTLSGAAVGASRISALDALSEEGANTKVDAPALNTGTVDVLSPPVHEELATSMVSTVMQPITPSIEVLSDAPVLRDPILGDGPAATKSLEAPTSLVSDAMDEASVLDTQAASLASNKITPAANNNESATLEVAEHSITVEASPLPVEPPAVIAPEKKSDGVKKPREEKSAGPRPWGLYGGAGVAAVVLLAVAYLFGSSDKQPVVPQAGQSENGSSTQQAQSAQDTPLRQTSPEASVPAVESNQATSSGVSNNAANTANNLPASAPAATQKTPGAFDQGDAIAGKATSGTATDPVTNGSTRQGTTVAVVGVIAPSLTASVPGLPRPQPGASAAATPSDPTLQQSGVGTAVANAGKNPVEANPALAGKPGAYVRFLIKPWGKVLVDGVDKGTSPPVVRLWLPEGDHSIVIENSDFQSYGTKVKVVDKKDVAVSHRFGQ